MTVGHNRKQRNMVEISLARLEIHVMLIIKYSSMLQRLFLAHVAMSTLSLVYTVQESSTTFHQVFQRYAADVAKKSPPIFKPTDR